MPDKVDSATSGKIDAGNPVPTTAVGIPVHVAGMHNITAYTLYHGHVPVAARVLCVWHHDHNRRHVRRGRDMPTCLTRSCDPLIGIAIPGNPVTGQAMILVVGPESALS